MNLDDMEIASFEDNLRNEFTKYDKQKTGFIDSNEFRKVLELYLTLTPDEINKITNENTYENLNVNYEGNLSDFFMII